MSKYDTTFFSYFENLKRSIRAMPLNLGGVVATGGSGWGGPPGGYVGYLPQGRVAYDRLELALSGFIHPFPYNASGYLVSASLLDNLNHIRYRLAVVEGLTFGGGTLRIEEDQNLVASGITVLNFTGPGVDVSSTGAGEVTITISGGGGSSLDEKVKISSNDTTTNYLENKIVAGSNVTVTVLNEGANEQLQIASTGGGSTPTSGFQVLARYVISGTQNFTTGVETIAQYNEKVYDSHNTVTTGSGWKFTAPRNGYYLLQAKYSFNAKTWSTSQYGELYFDKNGIVYPTNFFADADIRYGNGQSITLSLGGSTVAYLASGEYIHPMIYQNSGSNATGWTGTRPDFYCHISVTSVEPGFVTTSGIMSSVDEKVKISSADTTSNYLEDKITAGTNITVIKQNTGANENLRINVTGIVSTTDEKVKITTNDTTANFLQSKLAQGSNITITLLNAGGNEQLQIASTGGSGSPVDAKDEGITVVSGISFIDFRGPTVSAVPSGSGVVVTVSGFSSPFVGCKTYRTTNFQLSTSTGWQAINWETSEYESDSTMWSSGGNVYARESGYYKVDCQVTLSGALPTTERIQLGLFKNGSLVGNIWDGYYLTTSGLRSIHIPYQGSMAVNDYFSLQIINGQGTQPYVLSGIANTFLSMHKIQGQIIAQSADPKLASVYMGGSTYVTVPNVTETAITYNTETYDNASYWASGQNTRFYAPENGYYHFDAGAAWESIHLHGSVPFQVKIGLRKNGSTMLAQKWEWHDVNNGGARAEALTTPISVDLQLNGGDYVEVMVWHAKGSTANNIIRPDNYDTYCMVHKIQ